MDWYLPLTLISGNGLIIMSSASQIVSLNEEIERLSDDKDYMDIVERKVRQLKKLTLSVACLYSSVLFIVIAALIGATELPSLQSSGFYVLMAGICFMLLAIIFLVIYSVISVKIRQLQVNIAIKKH